MGKVMLLIAEEKQFLTQNPALSSSMLRQSVLFEASPHPLIYWCSGEGSPLLPRFPIPIAKESLEYEHMIQFWLLWCVGNLEKALLINWKKDKIENKHLLLRAMFPWWSPERGLSACHHTGELNQLFHDCRTKRWEELRHLLLNNWVSQSGAAPHIWTSY